MGIYLLEKTGSLQVFSVFLYWSVVLVSTNLLHTTWSILFMESKIQSEMLSMLYLEYWNMLNSSTWFLID
jgi:hypothetical protein